MQNDGFVKMPATYIALVTYIQQYVLRRLVSYPLTLQGCNFWKLMGCAERKKNAKDRANQKIVFFALSIRIVARRCMVKHHNVLSGIIGLV